jgi:hypothetical protein
VHFHDRKTLSRRFWHKAASAILTTSLYGAAVAGLGISTMLSSAFAATEIQRQGDELEVQAENASIKEILDALSGQFNLSYNQSSAVGRVLTGRFFGTLRQVLTRVLAGNDYVFATSGDTTTIVVLNSSSVAAVAAAEQSLLGNQNSAPPALAPAAARTSSLAKPIPSLSSYLQ